MFITKFLVVLMQLSRILSYNTVSRSVYSLSSRGWGRGLSTLRTSSVMSSSSSILPNRLGGMSMGLKMSGLLLQMRGGFAARNFMALSSAASSTAVEKPAKEYFRKDYRAPPYTIRTVDLNFQLNEAETLVTAVNTLYPTGDTIGEDLVLDGEEVTLVEAYLNDKLLQGDDYQVVGDKLVISGRLFQSIGAEKGFRLKTVVKISPEKNLALSGLYKSGSDLLCTQCEAMGYRRITYSLDRPDVLSVYRVRLEADRTKYPILLSNGNLVAEGNVANSNNHWAIWEDPFPKPSYLFALVAGDLGFIQDTYTTTSGRVVKLGIYSDKENVDKLDHAMYSLKESMKWDEDTFNLECDLDVYNIVATNDFNMGAMENKGLNIFNSAYVLADSKTATDVDYERILGVIGHEYFHNWSGNRVTVRDWFQLTLKEGLTVFRDQWFSADKTSAAVKRIEDVRGLRSRQFAEDAGPMAHPIRPESYISMDNFYTSTVYSKGAEIIGIYKTILGTEGFKKGLALYFERFDGQAVTCDDFRQAMADANSLDLSAMDRWYTQAGTPLVTITPHYDAATQTYTLDVTQETPATPGQSSADKLPVPIPLVTGLLHPVTGEELVASKTLLLNEKHQQFVFPNVAVAPVLSTLRDFSAPVNLHIVGQKDEELVTLMAHDTDSFNQWDAGNRYFTKLLLQFVADKSASTSAAGFAPLPDRFVNAIDTILQEAIKQVDHTCAAASSSSATAKTKDLSLLAYALTVPDEMTLLTQLPTPLNIDALHQARHHVKRALAEKFHTSFLQLYHLLAPPSSASAASYVFSPAEVGRRKLRNLCLDYLTSLPLTSATRAMVVDLPYAQYRASAGVCMTDALAAVAALIHQPAELVPERAQVLQSFYQEATTPTKNALVLNKWFAIQAMADVDTIMQDLQQLQEHPDFILSNPNRARSLLSTFSGVNLYHFHRSDGAGYRYMRENILALDKINPQVAARMLSCFALWKKFDEPRKALMERELRTIAETTGLSPDSFEVVSRYLK